MEKIIIMGECSVRDWGSGLIVLLFFSEFVFLVGSIARVETYLSKSLSTMNG